MTVKKNQWNKIIWQNSTKSVSSVLPSLSLYWKDDGISKWWRDGQNTRLTFFLIRRMKQKLKCPIVYCFPCSSWTKQSKHWWWHVLYEMLAEWEGNVGKEGIGREGTKPKIIIMVPNLGLGGCRSSPTQQTTSQFPRKSDFLCQVVGVCILI